ncbi:C4-dicarboxylate ABC transporter substrate-binding protein [Endozoicomonas montiporae]|uniref:C4-dicarboxylate ABC transporter substrate-binding protein n=2 Tax=Endozoicomonas montiporae TaxID=1027273 RepID=A0A081MZJ4_9GAMM|nr:TRAP transporter substrate-binding protein [Endozoicomonas montiporae]AMO54701.1 TRAP dicarboxylate transporter subunit DctP [Endozoicomonas montiporae CL-33]KEQ11617.1 C4-dicarboxylate ABC transporter substrate-binding protein [Endozoicomonas montiporae]
MFKHSLKLLAALALTAVTSTGQAATEMILATWLPASHPMNATVFPEWATQVEEATEGRVKVKLEYDLGHPKSYFDLVEDGVADAGWSVHGYIPGRFIMTEVAEMPHVKADARASSAAFWKVNKEFFAKQNEHEGIELLALFTNGGNCLYLTQPANSFNDIKGRKIRVTGGIASQLGELLGVTGISAPASKIYELQQQGVVDGTIISLQDLKALRLSEVTKQVICFPGGLYRASFSFFVSEDFMANLSAKDREAIRALSGEKLSARIGQVWEEADVDGINAAIAGGVEIINLNEDDAMTKELVRILPLVENKWLDNAKKRGVDGKAALQTYRQYAENYTPQG